MSRPAEGGEDAERAGLAEGGEDAERAGLAEAPALGSTARGSRRRHTARSHREFVGLLVHQMHESVAGLHSTTGPLGHPDDELRGRRTSHELDRLAQLVRILEAIDGDGSDRRLTAVDAAAVIRQAARVAGVALHCPIPPIPVSLATDERRLRLGLDLLFAAFAPDGTPPTAEMLSRDLLIVDADRAVLDGELERWRLRCATRLLYEEGWDVRLRTLRTRVRAEVLSVRVGNSGRR